MKKKNEYKLNILKDMDLKQGDQKSFWRLLDKLQPPCRNNDGLSNISGEKWKKHFKSILQSNRKLNYPPNSIEIGRLDYDITSEELSKASYVLKSNKATGFDSISNEMINCLLQVNPVILLKLSNFIIKQNATVNEWTISIINPIHKGGSKTDLSNFRGISILSCLGKLFSSILNLRLTDYVERHKILDDQQLGFRKGNRTSDAHIILYSLIQKYCHSNNQKNFSCFVDFKSAFDRVPRDLLFNKLLNLRITGNYFNVLKKHVL